MYSEEPSSWKARKTLLFSPEYKTARITARDTATKTNLSEQQGGQDFREDSIRSGEAHGPLPTSEESF